MKLYPSLLKNHIEQIRSIEKTNDSQTVYIPCSAKLRNGEFVENVCLVEAKQYVDKWGRLPGEDKNRIEIRLEDVLEFSECQNRLPAKYAQHIYESPESGMGFTLFKLVFYGFRLSRYYGVGGIADFVVYPSKTGPKDIKGIEIGVGRNRKHMPPAKYYWCLFTDE